MNLPFNAQLPSFRRYTVRDFIAGRLLEHSECAHEAHKQQW